MRSSRTIRSVAVLASVAMIFGAFAAGPAEAKKKKKKKKPAACAPYAPGETGAGLTTTTVTEAATAEKPVETTVDVGPGLGAGRDPGGEGAMVSHGYANLQVDTKAPDAKLNVQIAWDVPPEDYDVYLDDASGNELANSAGFGPVTSGSDYASSAVGSETIVDYPVADCNGFTIDVVGATTPGGTLTVRYWLN